MTAQGALEALLATTPLARLPRTGWLLAGVPEPESIADHAHGTSLVALALGPRVTPPLDVDRAVALAAVHDAPEALVTDLPPSCTSRLPEGAKASAEASAAADLLGPLSDLAHERWREYAAAETREARFAGLCDKLHMGVVMVAYARAGHRALKEFAASIASLDCTEFPPCEELKTQVLAAFAAVSEG